MDTVLIVARKFTEFGDDAQKIYSKTNRFRFDDYRGCFVAGNESLAAKIRTGRSVKEISRFCKTFGGHFQTQ
jgi:hypothetical protein